MASIPWNFTEMSTKDIIPLFEQYLIVKPIIKSNRNDLRIIKSYDMVTMQSTLTITWLYCFEITVPVTTREIIYKDEFIKRIVVPITTFINTIEELKNANN